MRKMLYEHRGFTLIEAMLAVVILAIAAAGVLIPFASGATVQADGIHRTMAAQLAGDLLEKIASSPFSTITATYNGYEEAQGQVKDTAENIYTDSAYLKFSRSATCEYLTQPESNPDLSKIFILVTVRVYYEGSEIVSLSRLVSG